MIRIRLVYHNPYKSLDILPEKALEENMMDNEEIVFDWSAENADKPFRLIIDRWPK